MDVLDIDNLEHQAAMQEDRPELDPDDAPRHLTNNELIDNMIVEGILDKRVLDVLINLEHLARSTLARVMELEASEIILLKANADLGETANILHRTGADTEKRLQKVEALAGDGEQSEVRAMQQNARITELEATVAELETAITAPTPTTTTTTKSTKTPAT